MKKRIFILSVPVLGNMSSASSEKHELLESVRYAAGLYNSMNGRHPRLARCQDET